jgi:archaellum biogenesis ATPase FlaH
LENLLLSSVLKSRESHDIITSYIKPKSYSREFQLILGFISDYYKRDSAAQSVERELLGNLISTAIQNEKHVDRFLSIVDEAVLTEASDANVRQIVLQAKQQELALALATAIANGKEHGELVEEYQKLLRYTSLDDMLSEGIEVYTHEDMARLLEEDADPTGRLMVYPLALNERLDGGMRPSDHMVLFARPEMGKTGLVVTMAGGFAKQKSRGIIFNNEERIARLYLRQISSMIGWTIHEIRANRDRAMELANEAGFEYIKFVSMSPGTLKEIDEYVEKEEPDWFIVDQLRNIAIKSESRTNQLESVTQGIRNIGKRRNTRAISITQAGDSGEGKAILEMGDIDFSNTGIQSACDVLVGVGATPEQQAANIRVFNLCKNKLGGVHEAFPTKFNPFISKYVSIKE